MNSAATAPRPLAGTPNLLLKRTNSRVRMPERQSPTSIAMDIFAFLMTDYGRGTSRAIHQKATTEVPTGLILCPPPGYYVQILPKAALTRRGILLANSPAIIDSESELTILLFNGSFETHYVAHDHRIAQILLAPSTIFRISSPEHQEDVPPGPGEDNS